MSSFYIFLLLVVVVASTSIYIPRRKLGDCGPNSVWSDCASGCPSTCSNYNDITRICPAVCRLGCACNKGYVIHDKTGKCVLISEC